MDEGSWLIVGLLGLGFFGLLAFFMINNRNAVAVQPLGTEVLTLERDDEGRLREIVSTRVKT